jgi:hypothetical protein
MSQFPAPGLPAPYDSTSTIVQLNAVTAERDALAADNTKLRTVMIAAAEEIQAHWDAHCDDEGYGPANLMRRLEAGIPVEYGYTAGAFAALAAELAAVKSYATALATSIHAKHYATNAPNWKPLDDAMGLLTQIDNMMRVLAAPMPQPAPPSDSAQIEGIEIKKWGHCSVCSHYKIPGEMCGRPDCPEKIR